MTVTVATFKTRFPEFASTSDARIQLFLDDADPMCDPPFWGADVDRAISYLAAHYLKASTSAATSPQASGITQMTLQNVTTKWSDQYLVQKAEEEYLGTTYGAEYLSMLKRKSGLLGGLVM